jgi:hypothetical protein
MPWQGNRLLFFDQYVLWTFDYFGCGSRLLANILNQFIKFLSLTLFDSFPSNVQKLILAWKTKILKHRTISSFHFFGVFAKFYNLISTKVANKLTKLAAKTYFQAIFKYCSYRLRCPSSNKIFISFLIWWKLILDVKSRDDYVTVGNILISQNKLTKLAPTRLIGPIKIRMKQDSLWSEWKSRNHHAFFSKIVLHQNRK